MQREDGGSVYLRLSTRPLEQPRRDRSSADLAAAIVDGGYWLREPAPGADLAIVYCGAVARRGARPRMAIGRGCASTPGCLPSPRPTGCTATGAAAQAERRVAARRAAAGAAAAGAALVTVVDGHPATLSWLGAVAQPPLEPLGVEHFGQSGDIPDLYRAYGIDADAILDAAARACLLALR